MSRVRRSYLDGRFGQLLERPDWGHGFLGLHAAEFGSILREFFDGEFA